MKRRAKFLLTCATGAIVISAGPMTFDAQAQTANKGGDVWNNGAPPLDTWWFHGEIEAGGRVFLNNPQKDGVASQGGKSLAKYYEYSTIKPGPFSNIWLATGSRDGLYQIDVGGKNIGYSDQNYYLEASKAGEQYFNFGWDQTPHVYSTSARTLYNGVGTNALTIPAGVRNQLFNAGDAADFGAVKSIIDGSVHQTDIGIRRDTASAEYRWTPTDSWDVKAHYSNMHRTGTQVDGVVMSPSENGVRTDVPAPVNDTTQNFGLNGEYAGTSFWGKKFNFKLAYNGSVYTDRYDSYTLQNPFCQDSLIPAACPNSNDPEGELQSFNFARMSLPPSNQANAFTATLGADLPSKSRYMGTFSYTMMRQNENFLPFTINPNLTADFGGMNPSLTSTLPFSSLNGSINTLLSNNVVTTQITPDLKSKLSYRYYDFANNTPELLFPSWVGADIAPHVSGDEFANVRSLSMSYTRQNAGAELNWHPTRQWNVGVAYGWERYDRRREDVDVTNENSGKIYADWKPKNYITVRASWLYSQRRYDTYDYPGFVAAAQWSPSSGVDQLYSPAYRQFFLDNRNRNVGKFSVAVDVSPNLRITPTGGWRNDNFNLNPATELGLQTNHSWDAGVEAAYAVSPDTRLLLSYTREHRSQLVVSTSQNEVSPPFPADSYYTANVEDNVNTFIVRADHALIPNKLDLSLGYTYSRAVNSQPINFADGHTPEGGQFPDVNNTFQRLDAILRYKFDENLVRQLGWKGNVLAKLRYAWERNSVANWQNDLMQNYMQPIDPSAGYMVWLAGNNPNYDVQLIAASLAFTW
jgi:MtrB/PioB family decaheme-associated outer membrane protein